ncbi:MAG: SCP2 sterol-binding domain-containing protein [Pseudomonadales bacterium]|nr:SCP2 sterol-binding domain-containing protein [Pseudomonadales bacterium]
MLQTAVILMLESTINKLLQTDEVTCQALGRLNGCVFEFKISDAPVHFYLLPYDGGIQLQQQFEAQADASFRGSLRDFSQLLLAEDKATELFGNGVLISGDTRQAGKLQRIISGAQIDWQELTAAVTGDLMARQLANFFSAGNRQLQITSHSVQLNFSEYLQEEIQLLPPRAEVQGFVADIDDLSQDSERLCARLDLIEAKIAATKKV